MSGYRTWPGRRRRWPVVLAALVAAAIGLAVGVLVGRAGGDRTATLPSGTSAGTGPCPSPRSQEGAVQAAVCYDTLLYRLEGHPEAEVRNQLQAAVANPAGVDRFARLVSQGTPPGGRAAAGVVTVHADTYGGQSAQVFLWTAVVRSARPGIADSSVKVEESWSTDAVVVAWTGDRWGLSEVSRSEATPPAGNTNLEPSWTEPPYARQ